MYYSDQLITFSGTIIDDEDDPEQLTGYWESSLDGGLVDVDVTPSSAGLVQGYSLLSQGQHAIELHGEDTTGKTCLSSVIIDVGPPNSAPSCAIHSPADGSSGPQSESVVFLASADDVDIPEDMLTAMWSSDKDGTLGVPVVDSDGSISFPYSNLSINTHVITLTVEDEVGSTCTSSIIYTVGTPPSVTITAPTDGDVIDEGSVVYFSATVFDAQEQPEDVSLDWTLNGVSLSTQRATTSGVAEFSETTLTFGTHHLVVTATDTDGLTDSDQINFTVNGIPSQPDISITPNPAYTNDALSVVIDIDSVDPEGATTNYTYEWLLGGNVQSSYTTSSVPSSATSKGEQWTVRVTPDDGMVSGEAATATVTISNTPPILSAISISPNSSVYLDTTLTCSVTVTDPDEIVIPTYEWSIGSATVGSAATLALSTVGANPADVVMCTALVVDGDGASSTDSSSVPIENRLPVVDSVALGPSTVYTNDTITATAAFSDDDSTQIVSATYAWHVIDAATGTDTQVQYSSNNTLSGVGHFNRDDEAYVVVTPNDGVDDGAPLTSSSITVSNTAPTTPIVSISPDPASVGQDDLVCSVDTPSSDDDGDFVAYTYVWTDDAGTVQQTAAQVSATTDTFAASGTTEGTWTCDVTPYDMTDYGPSDSAQVVLGTDCYSLEFDGGYVGVSDVSQIPMYNEPRTFASWFHPNADITSNLVSWGDGTSSRGRFSVHLLTSTHPINHTGSLALRFIGQSNDHFLYPVPLNEWTHVAMTYDGSNLSMYVNGAVVDSVSTYLDTDPNFLLRLGKCTSNRDEEYFYGYMSSAKIWNRDLSTTEVNDLYILGTAPQNGLVADWGFVGNGHLLDQTGNGHDGVLDDVQTGTMSWNDICPQDLDGDGVLAGEDCDDNDPSVQVCYESCLDILDGGASIGDGFYVIDPSGFNPLDVYCDMTINGGGWTRVLSIVSSTCENGFLDEFTQFSFTQGMLVNNAGEWIMTDATPYMNDNSGSDPSSVGGSLVSGNPISQITLPEDLQVTFPNGNAGWIGWNSFTRWDGSADSHFITVWRDCQLELGNVGGWFSHCSAAYGPGFGFGQQSHCTTSRGLFWNGAPYGNTIELYLR